MTRKELKGRTAAIGEREMIGVTVEGWAYQGLERFRKIFDDLRQEKDAFKRGWYLLLFWRRLVAFEAIVVGRLSLPQTTQQADKLIEIIDAFSVLKCCVVGELYPRSEPV